MRSYARNITAIAVFGLAVVACGAGSGESTAAPTTERDAATTTIREDTPVTTDRIPISAPTPEGPSALDAAPDGLSDARFPKPLIDTDRLIQGQVPDGIPAIDEPRFVDVPAAEKWMTDPEALVVVDINGDVRAYPVQILIWHEIINDTVGDVPVAVTYCPLCNSAVTYERRIDGRTTTFGTSGFLFSSALVMYDRDTESLWTQFDGVAVAGVRTGTRLEAISSPLLAWADFKVAYPDATVLDVEQTGYSRPYGSNPYVGYDDVVSYPFLFDGDLDDRAPAQQRVVGVNLDGVARAWTLEAISGELPTATHDSVGNTPVVILWKPGQSSALDASSIGGGRDVGSVGVFRTEIDGRTLTLQAKEDGFQDVETGSTWDVLGRAVAGPLVGQILEPIAHLDTFWFAWSSYNPATEFVGG